ncbi:PTS sugar transporter subunit IIA [Erwinia sp. CPCC 100877]|nr:PTS sugar transporter subunit IIA [Erwinia sp. CPCC 100877]
MIKIDCKRKSRRSTMNDKLIEVFLNCDLKSSNELFEFIAAKAKVAAPALLIETLLEREAVGSLFITEQVILPHLESEQLLKSQVFFITFKQPLLWKAGGTVKLAIVILLKTDEQPMIKRKIANLTRTFADEEYLQTLINEKAAVFYQKIKHLQEEL